LTPLYARSIQLKITTETYSSLKVEDTSRKRGRDNISYNRNSQSRPQTKVLRSSGSFVNPFGIDESHQPLYQRYTDPLGGGSLPQNPNALSNNYPLDRSATEGPAPSSVLTFSNLPYQLSDSQLKDMIGSKCQGAAVKDVRFPNHSEEYKRGRCWVEFESTSKAESTLSLLGATFDFEWRTIRVDFAKSGSMTPPPQTQMDIQAHPDCWFCLSNPRVEKKYFVDFPGSSSKEVHYTSLAKGGFNDAHLQITPVTHYPASAFCPKEVNTKLVAATNRVKKIVRSEGFPYIFCWERYFPMRNTNAMHMQIHVIGLRQPLIQTFENAVMNLEKDYTIKFELMPAGTGLSVIRDRVADLEDSFTYVEYENADGNKQAYFYVKPKSIPGRMPINLGRELLCCATGSTNLTHWQDCVLSDAEMLRVRERWRNAFTVGG